MSPISPHLFSLSPTKDDLEENKTVFECVTKLYHDGNLEVMKHMPQLILVGAQILQHKEVKESKTGKEDNPSLIDVW